MEKAKDTWRVPDEKIRTEIIEVLVNRTQNLRSSIPILALLIVGVSVITYLIPNAEIKLFVGAVDLMFIVILSIAIFKMKILRSVCKNNTMYICEGTCIEKHQQIDADNTNDNGTSDTKMYHRLVFSLDDRTVLKRNVPQQEFSKVKIGERAVFIKRI